MVTSCIFVRKGSGEQKLSNHKPGTPKEVLVENGKIPFITQIAIGTIPAGTRTELHAHPTMWEIYYVLRGKAVYTIGEKRIAVDTGDFFAVPPGTLHRQHAIEEHIIYYYGVVTDTFKQHENLRDREDEKAIPARTIKS